MVDSVTSGDSAGKGHSFADCKAADCLDTAGLLTIHHPSSCHGGGEMGIPIAKVFLFLYTNNTNNWISGFIPMVPPGVKVRIIIYSKGIQGNFLSNVAGQVQHHDWLLIFWWHGWSCLLLIQVLSFWYLSDKNVMWYTKSTHHLQSQEPTKGPLMVIINIFLMVLPC